MPWCMEGSLSRPRSGVRELFDVERVIISICSKYLHSALCFCLKLCIIPEGNPSVSPFGCQQLARTNATGIHRKEFLWHLPPVGISRPARGPSPANMMCGTMSLLCVRGASQTFSETSLPDVYMQSAWLWRDVSPVYTDLAQHILTRNS